MKLFTQIWKSTFLHGRYVVYHNNKTFNLNYDILYIIISMFNMKSLKRIQLVSKDFYTLCKHISKNTNYKQSVYYGTSPSTNICIIGGWRNSLTDANKEIPSNICQVINIGNNFEKKQPFNIRTHRAGLKAQQIDGTMFAIGGVNNHGQILNTMDAIKIRNNEVLGTINVSEMGTPRNGSSSIKYKSNIYMIGGETRNSRYESSVEYYDSHKNYWYNFPNMKCDRVGSDAVCVNNSIWVFGGMQAFKHLDAIYDERYENFHFKKLNTYEYCDPRVGKWCLGKNKMKLSRFALSVVHDNDYGIWIIGGKISDIRTNTVEFFDIRNQKWLKLTKNISEMNSSKGGVVSCCLGETIYIFGGRTHNKALSSIEKLDLYKNKWELSKTGNLGIGVFGAGMVRIE